MAPIRNLRKLILIFAIFHACSALELRKAVEGLLSGFQNTVVYIKDDCFSKEWKESLQEAFVLTRSNEIFERIDGVSQVYKAFTTFKTSCRALELYEITKFLATLDKKDFFFHTFLHSFAIFEEIYFGQCPTTTYELFKTIGKILRIWVDPTNTITFTELGDISYGFLSEFSEISEVCIGKTQTYLNLLPFFDCDQIASDFLEFALDFDEILIKCNMQNLKNQVLSAIWWKAYANFGTHLEEISNLSASTLKSLETHDFFAVGKYFSKIFKIIIR